ncbi:MAG: biopolymer transporter ExbD [Blastocatellia bacterium]|nr:biopolymer transporter ExbD [Blastocatellia bacterium]
MVVAIPADGQFYLGKELIAKERLTEKIKAMMENRKIDDRVVYIKGGALVSYGSIVDTISSIRESGIDRIGLVTDKEKEKAPGAASN